MNYAKFAENGKCLKICTPKTPTPWINLLFNDEYITTPSQRLCGAGFSMKNFKQKPMLKEEKYFYIKINDQVYRLCAGMGNSYECAQYLHKSVVTEEFDLFTSEITVFVPVNGKRELWQIRITNNSDEAFKADVFAVFPFANIDYQGLKCYYDTVNECFVKSCFPYYIEYSEYDTAKENTQYTYASSFPEPTTCECNLQRFFGGDNPYDLPDMVRNGKGSCKSSEFENSVAGFHHSLIIKKSTCIQYMLAEMKSENDKDKMYIPDFEQELKAAAFNWEKRIKGFFISSANKTLEYMTNYWLKKQVIYLTKFNRGGVYCPARNQLQDALGYAMINPDEAFRYALEVLKRQEENGYLKQWYMTDGSPEIGLCRLNHSDAPIWLAICMTEIIVQTGNMSLFDMEVKYFNSDKSDPIIVHLKNAIRYMCTQTGVHGLCLMKDGDWTDPINGAGRNGRGESVWNTMALIYAIKQLNKISYDKELLEFAGQMAKRVNEYCWDTDRYIVGFDDAGNPFGKKEDKEGSLFLNTQVWAIIAQICEDRQDTLYQTIEALNTDCGYLLLKPPFSEYNSTWGKISMKQKGATENGSIYSHANMFKAYADCLAGKFDDALQTIENILPKMDGIQAPLYLPNYYFGIEGDNFGRSSCVYSAGAPAWLLWIMKTFFTRGSI